jgi:hypothetical protein
MSRLHPVLALSHRHCDATYNTDATLLGEVDTPDARPERPPHSASSCGQ